MRVGAPERRESRRRSPPSLGAGLAALMLLAACSGSPDPSADGGAPDAGPDGGVATGEACPEGRPDGCAGQVCLTGAGGQSYCSEYCTEGTCPADMPCQAYVFGDAADIRDVCAPACTTGTECSSGTCEADGRCVPPEGTVGEGDACGGASGTCRRGLVCRAHGDVPARCLATCDPSADAFCASGAFCWGATVPGGGICWLGGGAALGATCQSHFDCQAGALCLQDTDGQRCRAGCDPTDGEPGCAAGTCTALPDRAYGFCLQ